MQALHQSYEKLFKSTAIFRCLHQPECCTLNSRLDFFYFSLERLRRSNSKDTVSLCRLPAQTWLKWLGWQKTMQWENCCLMNQISLAKGLIPEWVQCGWEEGRGDPFSVSELSDGLNCLVQHASPLPENSCSWVSKSLLEASLPKWRIHDHILLYTCSLQAWVSAFFSNSKWWLKLSTEEPQTWAALGQGKWSLKFTRFTPSSVLSSAV